MRRALYAVLLTGLFLLLLSALVVTPDLPDAPASVRMPADFRAVFRPVISAALPEAADALPARPDLRVILSVLPVLFMCAALFLGVRDANGHVLTAVRYENSVYQVFRPEVAGG